MVKEAQRQIISRITSAQNFYTLLHEYTSKEKEYFLLLTLDAASKVIEKCVIHIGTLHHFVHPREIFKPAITNAAEGIIISHNHPRRTLEASRADIQIMQRLKDVDKLVGIGLLDHVIISSNGYYSFSNEGLL